VSFDALAAPETAADMTLGLLLHPQRASRLIQQKAVDANQLGLMDVLDEVVANTINKSESDPYLAEVQRQINFRVLFHLMNLAAHTKVHPQVNAMASHKLQTLQSVLKTKSDIYVTEMVRRIDQFFKHPETFQVIPVSKIPDGSPIGMGCFH